MLFHINKKSVVYNPIPKCGCTSVKSMIYYILNDKIPDDQEDVHRSYPTRENFIKNDLVDYKFCVVRDPVERFISGYSNRILHHKDIPFVEFDYFVKNFYNFFHKSPKIRHHFRPQIDFIGKDNNYYTKIFWVHQMREVSDFLSEISKKDIPIFHKQTGGSNMKPVPTNNQIEHIRKFYKSDYEFLRKINNA